MNIEELVAEAAEDHDPERCLACNRKVNWDRIDPAKGKGLLVYVVDGVAQTTRPQVNWQRTYVVGPECSKEVAA